MRVSDIDQDMVVDRVVQLRVSEVRMNGRAYCEDERVLLVIDLR